MCDRVKKCKQPQRATVVKQLLQLRELYHGRNGQRRNKQQHRYQPCCVQAIANWIGPKLMMLGVVNQHDQRKTSIKYHEQFRESDWTLGSRCYSLLQGCWLVWFRSAVGKFFHGTSPCRDIGYVCRSDFQSSIELVPTQSSFSFVLDAFSRG